MTKNNNSWIYPHSSVPWQQEILKDFLSSIPKKKRQHCLDAGTGIGNNLSTLRKLFENVVACDVSNKALNYASQRFSDNSINFINTDIKKIPFPENYFDVVVCTEVLEHVEGSNNVIKEILRVLKSKEGYLIVSTPNYFNLAGIVKVLIDSFSKEKNWDVWGTSKDRIEKPMTWYKLKNSIIKQDVEIIKERGGDFLNSWFLFLPFVFRNFKLTDNHPFLFLGTIPGLKKLGMNYFILAKVTTEK